MQSADRIEFLVHTYADRITRIGYTWFGNVHDAQDVCQTVLRAVQSLPLKYRKVIYLHYYEGYTVGELAKLLGLPPNLVSTHLTRAKRKLRKQLGGEPNEQTISG